MAVAGKFNRLVITTDDSNHPDGPQTFEAYVNPAEVTLGYEAQYEAAQSQGSTPGPLKFNKIKPGDLTIAFFLDGTGANGRTIVVQDEIDHFFKVTGYAGSDHKPRPLVIAWGKLSIFRCQLKSASTAYKVFSSDGVPIRAVVTAVFTESVDAKTSEAKAGKQSADLTHVRLVQAGDTLPRLCQAVYREPRMYIEVARANGLDNFRALKAGTRLRFPPLAK